jgi:hypothetical protein
MSASMSADMPADMLGKFGMLLLFYLLLNFYSKTIHSTQTGGEGNLTLDLIKPCCGRRHLKVNELEAVEF